MFNIFRRSRPTPLTPEQPGAVPTAGGANGQSAPAGAAAQPAIKGTPVDIDPALPEVVEGSDETNWKMWEQAVSGKPVGDKSQWEKTWPGMEAPPPATPSQLEETVRMPRMPSNPHKG